MSAGHGIPRKAVLVQPATEIMPPRLRVAACPSKSMYIQTHSCFIRKLRKPKVRKVPLKTAQGTQGSNRSRCSPPGVRSRWTPATALRRKPVPLACRKIRSAGEAPDLQHLRFGDSGAKALSLHRIRNTATGNEKEDTVRMYGKHLPFARRRSNHAQQSRSGRTRRPL